MLIEWQHHIASGTMDQADAHASDHAPSPALVGNEDEWGGEEDGDAAT